MQTIVVGNAHGLRPGKNAIVTPITRADRCRIGAAWRSPADLPHDTSVDEVNHFGRHTTSRGEVLRVESLGLAPIMVEVLYIQVAEVAKLTDSDFRSLGYTDRADYMADWGEISGPRVWLYRIAYLLNYNPEQVS